MHQNMHQARVDAKGGKDIKEGVQSNLLILIGLLWCREGGSNPSGVQRTRKLLILRIGRIAQIGKTDIFRHNSGTKMAAAVQNHSLRRAHPAYLSMGPTF